MNILFIHPPHNPKVLTPSNFEPLALEILAQTVPEHTVKILDLRFDHFDQLNHLLSSFKPRVIGLTVNNTIHVNQAKIILKYIKRSVPDINNIVGGHHATLSPQDFFEPYIDAIFLGWAERSLPQYINRLHSNKYNEIVENVILVKEGIPFNLQNVKPSIIEPDVIPVPDRSVTRQYRKHYKDEFGHKTVLVNTARGCPYRCTFCACWKAAGEKYIIRSAEDVLKELAQVPDDIEFVFFADDNTFFDLKRAEKLCYLINKHDIRKRYSGYCRSDTIVKYPQLFKNWKEIGLDNITIGFEATSEYTIKRYNKANTVENNIRAIQILNELKINFSPYFLIEPEFEKENFEDISFFVEKYNLINPMFTILTPLPGTDLYKEKKEIINLDYDYFDFMHWVYPTKLKSREFFKYFVNLYYNSYSYKRYIKILSRLCINLFKKNLFEKWELNHLSLAKIILLRIMAFPLRRKLYRQYVK